MHPNAELAAAFSDHHVLVGPIMDDELRRADLFAEDLDKRPFALTEHAKARFRHPPLIRYTWEDLKKRHDDE
jgi:hypothetical protein